MDQKFWSNPIQQHSAAMLLMGAITWAAYILFVNTLSYFNILSLEIATIIGIPLSWILNYSLNSLFNFRQPFGLKRFLTFCMLSGVGWIVYLGSIFILIREFQINEILASVIAILPKTLFNIIFQQAITFGWLGHHEHVHVTRVRLDYDWMAFFYGNPLQKWWKQKIFTYIHDWHIKFNSKNIVDIGCGSSPTLSLLQAPVKVGVEIDEDKVNFMRWRDKSSLYYAKKAEDTGLPSDFYDLTLCIEVLEHHLEPHSLIKELARITKPEGYVVIATPDFATPAWNIIEVLYGLVMRKGYHGEHNTKFTESSVKALAYAYNLRWQETRTIWTADKIMLFKKGE